MAEEVTNTTPPAPRAAAPAEPVERVAIEDYEPQGNFLVKAKMGYTVAPHDLALPIIHEQGVRMTKDQAAGVAAAYEDYLVLPIEEIKE